MKKRYKLVNNHRELILSAFSDRSEATFKQIAKACKCEVATLNFTGSRPSDYGKAFKKLLNEGILSFRRVSRAYVFRMEKQPQLNNPVDHDEDQDLIDPRYNAMALDNFFKEFFDYHLTRQTAKFLEKIKSLEGENESLRGEVIYWEQQAKQLKADKDQIEVKSMLTWMK